MSDFVVHKGQRAAGTFARHYNSDVREVRFQQGAHTSVVLADGRAGVGSCLGCANAPCMEKAETELTLFGQLDEFPGDPSRDVCPTKAVRWVKEKMVASVAASDCIGCGLCISRCPYGAMRMLDGTTAHVATEDPDKLIVAGWTERDHPTVKSSGSIAALDSPAGANLSRTVASLDDARTNLLVRNLLNEVGMNARTRRRGDTNIRIDAVGFSRQGKPFVAEIELGQAVLESPRALLEDVAVLHARYGYEVRGIDPISIILSFPNVRSDYYQVIRDIEKVLDVRCRTVTIGALVALLWNRAKLDGFDREAFSVGAGTIDLTDSLGLDRAHVVEPYPGAFKPAK